MKDSKQVIFDPGGAQFNKGIVVQAQGGVVLSGSVISKNQPSLVSAGVGTLTIVSGKTVSTTNQLLSITADDINFCALDGGGVDLNSCGGFDTGTSTATIECTSPGTAVAMGGSSASGMHLAGFELKKFYGAGLAIGAANCGSQATQPEPSK